MNSLCLFNYLIFRTCFFCIHGYFLYFCTRSTRRGRRGASIIPNIIELYSNSLIQVDWRIRSYVLKLIFVLLFLFYFLFQIGFDNFSLGKGISTFSCFSIYVIYCKYCRERGMHVSTLINPGIYIYISS